MSTYFQFESGPRHRQVDSCPYTIDMNIEEILWSAGYYEGEGFVKAYMVRDRKKYHYPRLQAAINCTDRDCLETMQKIWGGSVYPVKHAKGSPAHWKPVFGWAVSQKKARNFLTTILPHLHERRALQVKTAVEKYQGMEKWIED